MRQKNRLIPSPALGVALLALVLAMSGAAIALPGKASVKKDDIAKGAVTAKAIAKNAVRSKNIKTGAVTGADVKDESLTSKDIRDKALVSSAAGNFVRLTATEAATEAAARAAAPPTTLFQKGSITITAKCFRDTALDETHAEIYVATNADGAIFDGGEDELSGGNAATDFLNVATLETDRQIDVIAETGASASLDETEFTIVGPDGTHVVGQSVIGAKNGNLAGGNGVYGAGNVCLFGGHING